MEKASNKISKTSQLLLILGALSLIITYFVPLWRIDLWAPQYPEGLTMKIWLNKLAGDVEIINGLNHYIGMAHIKEEMFPEFQILPMAIGILIALAIISALTRNKKVVLGYLIVLIVGAVVAMYDFWKWEYEYGHNLSDDAPIKVPGMSYQPPLLGYKQLLNFGAYSIPDIGGWLFVAFGLLVVGIVYYEFKGIKKGKKGMLAVLVPVLFLMSCSPKTEAFNYGTDQCSHCKMSIVEDKFACEAVTSKGKVYKYDDISCMVKDLAELEKENVKFAHLVVNNFNNPSEFVNLEEAQFDVSDKYASPMAGNTAAFVKGSQPEAKKNWTEIKELFK